MQEIIVKAGEELTMIDGRTIFFCDTFEEFSNLADDFMEKIGKWVSSVSESDLLLKYEYFFRDAEDGRRYPYLVLSDEYQVAIDGENFRIMIYKDKE